jgi:PHD/YefM family antitoxin component YafN of YafNO toxin-antitoxin module
MFMNSHQAQAVTPQVRLPDWHSTSFSLAEWKPEEGILVISVMVKADQVDLSDISSRLYAPAELNIPVDRHERKTLKKGEKTLFMHKINVKPGFAGWIELDIRAMPDRDGLLELAAKNHAKEPLTLKIVEEEIKTISQPLFIGTSLPVLLSDDIAISTMPEATFRNDFEADDCKYYLWYPPEGLGKGITAEGLKVYSTAIRSGSLTKSESAARMLLRRFETNSEPITIEKKNGETFMLPTAVAADLIEANQLTLQAVTSKRSEELARRLATMEPVYTRPFLYYNLAILENSLKKKTPAIKHLEQALSDLPAWPLAEKLLKQLKK